MRVGRIAVDVGGAAASLEVAVGFIGVANLIDAGEPVEGVGGSRGERKLQPWRDGARFIIRAILFAEPT